MLRFGDTWQDGAWTEDRNRPETPVHTAKQASQDGRTGQDFRENSVNSCGDPLLNRCGLLQIGLLSYLYPTGSVRERAIVIQQKTGRPVQFELTDQIREAIADWIAGKQLKETDYLFPSRVHGSSPHLSTRQHARIVNHWVESIGLDPRKYGTHSMRRTKAALIYKKTGNLRAAQLLLGHTKLDYVFYRTMSRITDNVAFSQYFVETNDT